MRTAEKQTCMTKNRIRSLLRQNDVFDFTGENLSYKKVQDEMKEYKTIIRGAGISLCALIIKGT